MVPSFPWPEPQFSGTKTDGGDGDGERQTTELKSYGTKSDHLSSVLNDFLVHCYVYRKTAHILYLSTCAIEEKENQRGR